MHRQSEIFKPSTSRYFYSPDFGDAVKFIENVFRNDMMTFFYGYYHGWNLPIQIEDRAFGPKSILLLAIAMLVVLFLFARSVSYFLYDTSGYFTDIEYSNCHLH